MIFNKKEQKTDEKFSKIVISLASPEDILEHSSGEVLKPETINYRTYKPEREGLFCERIFGPTKDWECHCGKYKRIRYKGIVCDRCGVEVTEKKVRRERTGHINLVVPVAHIWYFKSLPNKIGYLLGLPSKKLDMIIYYERYVVINPAGAQDKEGEPIEYLDFLTEDEYYSVIDSLPKENQFLSEDDPKKFIAKMGAEALYDLLRRTKIEELSYELRYKANNETSQQRKLDALKRLQVVEAFRLSNQRIENKPEWMIIKVIPVIPPELRPLVPLDGGRFATSDLNDLYRRVIIRNNRLKRLIQIKAPDVILRNEKRMLQEAVDALFDNSRKSSAVKTDSNRALKSLSDSLKGKAGRFRQNLLGKRVDYSARSVIVVGPDLELHECGLPKDMSAELYKPFIIRKLIERGIVKTLKSAKQIVEKKEPVVWDILEKVMKGHPVLLNRAPTLHRLGIQAFQPKLIEGKAIRLHPLVCTAFNADFDGDQMAVHLPLGNAAILEAQLLMLASHNILSPSNGAPITLPSQDMILGLYYISKERESTKKVKVSGEGKLFYSSEEVIIAYNEKKLDLHAKIKVRINDKIIQTTTGRILFNEVVPEGVEFVNEILTKKAIQKIIGKVLSATGNAKTVRFLDDIKNLGFEMAFRGGLSFNLDDIVIPHEKQEMINEAHNQVEEVKADYNMGYITNNERYNQIIDIWTHTNIKLTNTLMNRIKEDNQGFNSIYMMFDSGARGSKEQIRQLSGIRGLMAKPRKSGGGQEIIESPILANFKEGLSVLEYFISTHGARKGLADTALKTADAGYLTRRLVDVAQDVIINFYDCETLRGIVNYALKNDDEIIEPLSDRIIGRTTVHDVYHPDTNKKIISSGEEITESIAEKIEEANIESVEIRSVLTCEAPRGVCAKCYGRNLATGKMARYGEAVGVTAAQSIGEPGTQLTLRTFHIGGTASKITGESNIVSKYDGVIEIEELKTIEKKNDNGDIVTLVIGRAAEMRIVNPKTKVALTSGYINYGSQIFVKPKQKVKKGQKIAEWDPYNSIILADKKGAISFEFFELGVTYKEELDEQTGFTEKVISEIRDKKKIPVLNIVNSKKEIIGTYNLPVGSHILVDEGEKVELGKIMVKIPRVSGSTADITGGLPRVTELFEARNPSNPALVSEIDGIVSFGKIKRGNREVIIESKDGKISKYLLNLSKHILVQENDFVRAGTPLTEGAITLTDILAIKGPTSVQEYIVNEVQEVYRLQGVKINDKHFEVIVRQMMRKVLIEDPGDTRFLEKQIINKNNFINENDWIYDKLFVEDEGNSETFKRGQIISSKELRDENSKLKRQDKKIVVARSAVPATSSPILQGITKASLQTESFMSAASFQETTKVLNEAAVKGKVDYLLGLKENVIVGNKIPAGTGIRDYEKLIVGSKKEYEQLVKEREDQIKEFS